MDSNGRIIRGREDDLDRSSDGDRLIKIGTLMAYHEQEHARQEAGAEGVDVDSRRQGYSWEHERARVDAYEYDAYALQEQADIELGASLLVRLVTDGAGEALDRAEAIDNIVDMERGVPLEHGPDYGWVRPDALLVLRQDAGVTDSDVPRDPGNPPGWKRPGWKRPGHLIE